MSKLNREWDIFICSLLFFTRIPVKLRCEYSPELQNKAAVYLPIVGWITGGFAAAVFWLSYQIFPHSVSIIISTISTVLLTGAFHEDGFSDSCDGFGGGWNKERILTIMKDSRVGAYGLIGTVLIFYLKIESLKHFSPQYIMLALLLAHSLSRFIAFSFMFTHQYARTDDSSKTKDTAHKPSTKQYIFAFSCASVPLFLFASWKVFIAVPVLFICKYLFGRYLNKKLGGYTGDALGAAQQVAECIIYLVLLAL